LQSPAATAGCVTAAAAAAEEEGSVTLLHQLSGFQRLEGLELQHLPCLNPAGLHVALHPMPQLSHFVVSAAGVSKDLSAAAAAAAAGVAGRCSSSSTNTDEAARGVAAFSRGSAMGPSLKSFSIKLPAQLPAALAAAAAAAAAAAPAAPAVVLPSAACSAAADAAPGRCCEGGDVGGRVGGTSSVSAQVLQGVLSQALPWAGVAVSTSACAGFERC
jgi:hypothetical protein